MAISLQAVVQHFHVKSKPRFIYRSHAPRVHFDAGSHVVPQFNLFNKPVSQSLSASLRSQFLVLPRAIAAAAVPDPDSSLDKDEDREQHAAPIILPDSQIQRESEDTPIDPFPFDPFVPPEEEEDDDEEGGGGEEDKLIKATITKKDEEQHPVPIIPPDSQVQRESEDTPVDPFPFDPFTPPEEEEDDDEEGGGGEEDKLIKTTNVKQEEAQVREQDEEQHPVPIIPPGTKLQRESEDTPVNLFPFNPFPPPEQEDDDDEESGGGEEDKLIETTTAKQDETQEQDQVEEQHPVPTMPPDSQLQRESEDTPADPFVPPEDEEEDDHEEGGSGGEEDKLIQAVTTKPKGETPAREQPKQMLSSNVQLALVFGLWYFQNVVFNIYNKKVLVLFPFPWLLASFQLLVGSIWMGFLWSSGLQPCPRVSKRFLTALLGPALFHAVGHISACVSISRVAVSFTHVIKASEPVFSVIFSALHGQFYPIHVWISIIPIVAGCSLAAITEVSFNAQGLWGALVSNIGFVLRNIYSKQSLYDFKHINGLNLYGFISIVSFLYLFPVAIFVEGSQWVDGIQKAIMAASTPWTFYSWLLLSGIFYHLYNQTAYHALDRISPLTFSVGNTMKRVVVIMSSVLVFRNPIRPLNGLGSAIAILGTFLYSQATAAGKKKDDAVLEKMS